MIDEKKTITLEFVSNVSELPTKVSYFKSEVEKTKDFQKKKLTEIKNKVNFESNL